ncbi:MAG TPA: ATP-binding cassette domain-containing protein, partial [Bacillota bacterium]|nr:ATP-binding cassette domain-containing protein [Bacillota bacterium]
RHRRRYQDTLELVYRTFPVLKKRSRQISATLSGGEQQMLAIGRALMTRPLLLCIDEPSTGLSPLIKQELFARIKEINESGITMLLVEQDVNLTLAMSTRSYILSHSKIVARGDRNELLADETIRRSYLGL